MTTFKDLKSREDVKDFENHLRNESIKMISEFFSLKNKVFIDEIENVHVFPNHTRTAEMVIRFSEGFCRSDFQDFLRENFGMFDIAVTKDALPRLTFQFRELEKSDFFKKASKGFNTYVSVRAII